MPDRTIGSQIPAVLPIYDVGTCRIPLDQALPAVAFAGARWLQIRDKTGSDRDCYRCLCAAKQQADSLGLTLLLNDRVDVAAAVGGVGVHLGQEDLPVRAARRVLGNEVWIGLSTRTLAQVRRAQEEPIDYFAVGPVFATTSKVDAGQATGLEHVRAARGMSRLPLVAIGGIDTGNAAEVFRAGADCVAAIAGIFAVADPADAVARMVMAASQRTGWAV